MDGITMGPLASSADSGKLFEAMAKAQAVLEEAPRLGNNPAFKSKYAKLDAIMEVAKRAYTAQGIAIIQGARLRDGSVEVETRLGHASGEWISATIGAKPKDLSPQGVGSAITYLRRYGLACIAGVVADEDDDGNLAQGMAPRAAPPPPPPRVSLDEAKAELARLADALEIVPDKAKFSDLRAEAVALAGHLERMGLEADLDALRAALEAARSRLKAGQVG